MSDTEEVETPNTEDEQVVQPEVEETDTDPFEELEDANIAWDDGDSTDGDDTDDQDKDATEEESKEETEEADNDADTEESTEEVEVQKEETSKVDETKEPQEDSTTSDELKKDKAREAFKLREAERQLRTEKENSKRLAEEQWVQQSQDNEELESRKRYIENERQAERNSSLVERELGVQVREAAAELNLKGEPKAVQQALAKSIDRFVALNTTQDKNGRVTGVKEGANVHQYLKEELDSIRELTNIGARQQTAQKAKQKQRTVARPTRTPKEKKVDSDLDAFDAEFYR